MTIENLYLDFIFALVNFRMLLPPKLNFENFNKYF